MDVNQDWSIAWPTASTFKWSVVPFPVRQGFVENLSENGGIVPAKYANAELMKIPNFFHLAPAHIKKQCDALKQFCTEWPAGLDETQVAAHFPVEVTTTDYCYAGPSVRDPRARVVRVKVKTAGLSLDSAAEEKLQRLAGTRYDGATKILTLVVDRCPLRKQNYDYAMYLLTALYHESVKVESWESEKTVNDLLSYSWESSQSKATCLSLLQTISKQASANEDELLRSDTVVEYARAVENLHNQPETVSNLNAYKESVLKLLKLNASSK